MTIFFEDDLVLVSNVMMHQPRLIVEVPSLFSYTDNKMVPCNYNYNYVHKAASANISGIERMTQSGRCYAPIMVEKTPSKLVEEIPKQKESEMVPNMIKG